MRSGKSGIHDRYSEDITDLKEKEEKLRRYSAGLELEVKERIRELRASEKRITRWLKKCRIMLFCC